MTATKTAKLASGGILALLFGRVNVVVQKGCASGVCARMTECASHWLEK
jgi:hypothetical protein